MSFDVAVPLDLATDIVVRHSLAGRQLELALSSGGYRAHSQAWITPSIHAWRDWLAARYAGGVLDGPPLLSSQQSLALWRQIIEESRSDAPLIDTRSLARWAASAYESLMTSGADPAKVYDPSRAAGLSECRDWMCEYAERRTRCGWTDTAQILTESKWLASIRPSVITLWDPDHDLPAFQRLVERLKNCGWRIEGWEPADGGRSIRQHGAEHGNEELRNALDWLIAQQAETPESRVALIVDDLALAKDSIERHLKRTARLTVGYAVGGSLDGLPAIAAARNALALLGPESSCQTFGNWLLSPFFHSLTPDELPAAALCEAQLRSHVASHLNFRAAHRSGAISELLSDRAPQIWARLNRALTRLRDGPADRSPSAWSAAWRAALVDLGWGRGVATIPAEQRAALDSVLDRFSTLTPILGAISASAAISELSELLRQTSPPSHLPISGLHVFDHIDQVGAGYTAAWAAGISWDRWPRANLGNPLIPAGALCELGLAWATPEDTLRRHRQSMQRLANLVPQVVFSWARNDDVGESAPSVLLRELSPRLLETDAGSENDWRSAAHDRSMDCLETLDDRPPPLRSDHIPGGVSALNLQAACPLRAFIEFRLHAHALEPYTRGLSPRVRGITLHRAAELLLPPGTCQKMLAAKSAVDIEREVRAATDKAVRETLSGSLPWLTILADVERARIRKILVELMKLESLRSDFRIEQTETRIEMTVGCATISARLDRLDRLADGRLGILDYKSGRSVSPAGWFSDRLADVQIPIYAIHFGDRLGATVLCALTEDPGYRGYWDNRDDFPGSSVKLAQTSSWTEQVAKWEIQLDELAAEFVGGDGRIFADDPAPAEAFFAPLTRVYQRLPTT